MKKIIVIALLVGGFIVAKNTGPRNSAPTLKGWLNSTKSLDAETPLAPKILADSTEVHASASKVPPQAVDATRSNLKVVNKIGKKVIRNGYDDELYKAALSNVEMINLAVEALVHDQEVRSRMEAVDFLANALSWKANPRFEHVWRVSEEFLTSDAISAIEDIKERKLRAADKIELAYILSRASPDRYREFESRPMSETNKKILTFTRSLYGSKKQGA